MKAKTKVVQTGYVNRVEFNNNCLNCGNHIDASDTNCQIRTMPYIGPDITCDDWEKDKGKTE